VPLAALGLALSAAFLHASWNLLAARERDTQAALSVALVMGSLALLPFAVARWHVDAAAWPYVALSIALETLYLVLLGYAYDRADLSLVYPIARGLAPVVVLVGAAFLLGQHLSALGALGVVLVAVGVVLVRGLRSPAAMRDVLLAMTIAVVIAGYTLADQRGVRLADPVAYAVLVVGAPALILGGLVAMRRGAAPLRTSVKPSLLVAGLCGSVAYALVLAALTLAPAALVAAVRETGVVMATAMGALLLGERVEPARWLGSVVVVVGIVLLLSG
jgi:drug/metabolite transporter (DMT)-like permease